MDHIKVEFLYEKINKLKNLNFLNLNGYKIIYFKF